MGNQPHLLPDLPPKTRQTDDFLGILPDKVMPTHLMVLEQDESLLFVKYFNYRGEVTRKQRQIFKQLVRMGETDVSGSVTVFCVWGLRGTRDRKLYVFDRTGEREIAVTDEILRAEISDWWRDHRRGGF